MGTDRLFIIGSPPLARGKLIFPENHSKIFRITPACAGKTHRNFVLLSRNWDHPRLRGENQNGLEVRVIGWGSPPLARGKLEVTCCDSNGNGITPACAGKTHGAVLVLLPPQDHPRLRGENTKKSLDLRDPCFLSYHISFNLNSHFLCSFLKSFHIFETISCNHPMLYVSVFLIHNMPLT